MAQMKAQGASEEDIVHVKEQATLFYFERKRTIEQQGRGETADADSMQGQEEQPGPASDAAEAPSQKYPSSFHAIVELIATGQESKIPGIRDIPLQINADTPSESRMERPKKPWET